MSCKLVLKSLANADNPNRDSAAKKEFHLDSKAFLRSVAKALAMLPTDFNLGSRKGGSGAAGEITLHSDRLYIQVFSWYTVDISGAYRACRGRQDFSGHSVNIIPMAKLKSFFGQQIWLKQLNLITDPIKC